MQKNIFGKRANLKPNLILEVPVHAMSSGMGFLWQSGSPSTHMYYTGKIYCSLELLSSITQLTKPLL